MPQTMTDQQTTPHPTGLVTVDGRTFPLESAALKARAAGGIAATTLSQHFRNPYPEPLEVHYTFPLPADGSVIAYTIHLAGRIIRGEVRPREEAREQYEQALLEGKAAGLLEQERAETFSQSLGSLPPGEPVTVEIEVLQPLAFLPAAGGRAPSWEYRFPTVVGVRYQGAPGRVPDAGKLDVDRADGGGTPVRVELDLHIADGPAGEILPESPSHGVEAGDAGPEDGAAQVRLAGSGGSRLDRDLIVRWKAAGAEVGVALREGPGIGGDDGRYALLTLTPPEAPAASFARDLTLLIDASGSMCGAPLDNAKLVAAALLRSLEPEDRFEILAFSNNVEKLTRKPVHATAGRVERAFYRLQRLQAGGATEMTAAMMQALETLRPDSQRQVVLLTDGYIGFESEVIGQVMARLTPGARVHAVGIGSAPNRGLTRGVAQAGRGVEVLVDNDGSDAGAGAREAAARLCRATERPVLTEVSVGGTAVASAAPARCRDVMAGQPLLVGAELAADGGVLEVSGRLAGQAGAWVRRIEVGVANPVAGGALPLGALFGRWAVEDCELGLAATQDSVVCSAMEREIETLGMRHGITTRQTSLVAVSEDPTVDPKDPRRKVRLPVELPAGLSAEGVGLTRGFSRMDLLMCRQSLQAPVLANRAMIRSPKEQPKSSASLPWFSSEDESPVECTRDADVLQLDGDVLVIEFPAPARGFRLPEDSDTVEVRFPDGHTEDAKLIREDSSPAGPHDRGLIVRLALRLQGDGSWHHPYVILRWSSVRGRFLRWRRGNLTLMVRIDERFRRPEDNE